MVMVSCDNGDLWWLCEHCWLSTVWPSRHWYGWGVLTYASTTQALTRWSGGARGESFQRMTLAKAVSSEKHVMNHYYLLLRSNKSFILLLGYGLYSLGIPFELSYSFAPLQLYSLGRSSVTIWGKNFRKSWKMAELWLLNRVKVTQSY